MMAIISQKTATFGHHLHMIVVHGAALLEANRLMLL